MQYNYQCRYLVVIIDDNLDVYKYEKYKVDLTFLSFQTKHIFISKSKVCKMTEFSEAMDNPFYDGNTILLEIEGNEYMYISGSELYEFKTEGEIVDYTSLMGNNMCPYAVLIGEEYTYFIDNRYKFIENDKIEDGTLLNATKKSLDPFDYHLGKCGIDSFKKLECSQIHSFYSDIEDDIEEEEIDILVEDNEAVETNYCNGDNEVVKTFDQKCVISYEKDSVYIFRKIGHQCICEQCYQNKGDIDILKGVVCRT